jgi:hypothetical protein
VFDEFKPGSAKTSIREETGAFGERTKGTAQDAMRLTPAAVPEMNSES